MGLSLRRSYEKVRATERAVRRGRDPALPVTLYQEIDGITERVDALTTLIGGTRDSLAQLLLPERSIAPAGGPKAVVKTKVPVFVPLSGTAGAAHASEWVAIHTKFEMISATLNLESKTTCSLLVEYMDSAQATIQMLRQAATVQSRFQATFQIGAFVGNETVVQGQLSYVTSKVWEPGSVRFRIASASPNSRVSGVFGITAYNEV